MAKKAKKTTQVWRSSEQIRGYRAQLVSAIRCSEDGAYAQLDLTTARALVEICEQAALAEKHRLPIHICSLPT